MDRGGRRIGASRPPAPRPSGVACASRRGRRPHASSPRRRGATDDVRILDVDLRGAVTIVLQPTADSLLPGDYSFWFDGDRGHARLGEILGRDGDRVTRELLGGRLRRPRARRGAAAFSGWFY